MANHTLGNSLFGQALLGNGATSGSAARPLTNAVTVTFTVASAQYGASMGITYTLQGRSRNAILAYYLISAQGAFALNGDSTIVSPDQVVYTPRPVVNRTLIGSPALQGYKQMTWTYTVLQVAEFSKLIGFYNPSNPLVTVTFPDETGLWTQQQVVMLPPTYGTQSTVVVNNVQLAFTRLQ